MRSRASTSPIACVRARTFGVSLLAMAALGCGDTDVVAGRPEAALDDRPPPAIAPPGKGLRVTLSTTDETEARGVLAAPLHDPRDDPYDRGLRNRLLGNFRVPGTFDLSPAAVDRWLYLATDRLQGTVMLPAGETSAEIELSPMPVLVLSVMDSGGNPVAHADLVLFPDTESDREIQDWFTLRRRVSTDHLGTVKIPWPWKWGDPARAEVLIRMTGLSKVVPLRESSTENPQRIDLGAVGHLVVRPIGGGPVADVDIQPEAGYYTGTEYRGEDHEVALSVARRIALEWVWLPNAENDAKTNDRSFLVPLGQRFRVEVTLYGGRVHRFREFEGPRSLDQPAVFEIDTRAAVLRARVPSPPDDELDLLVLRQFSSEAYRCRVGPDGAVEAHCLMSDEPALLAMCTKSTAQEFHPMRIDRDEIDLGDLQLAVRPSVGYVTLLDAEDSVSFAAVVPHRLRWREGCALEGLPTASGVIRIRKVRDLGWELVGLPSIVGLQLEILAETEAPEDRFLVIEDGAHVTVRLRD
ncbi:MAG: hypothetical protein AB7I19_17115 [Planctomycetota bacterium]